VVKTVGRPPQHPDKHRPNNPVLLAVDQELGEGTAPWIAPDLSIMSARSASGIRGIISTPLRPIGPRASRHSRARRSSSSGPRAGSDRLRRPGDLGGVPRELGQGDPRGGHRRDLPLRVVSKAFGPHLVLRVEARTELLTLLNWVLSLRSGGDRLPHAPALALESITCWSGTLPSSMTSRNP
jgi:hypothetical protein